MVRVQSITILVALVLPFAIVRIRYTPLPALRMSIAVRDPVIDPCNTVLPAASVIEYGSPLLALGSMITKAPSVGFGKIPVIDPVDPPMPVKMYE